MESLTTILHTGIMRLGYQYVIMYEKGVFNLQMLSTKRSVRLACLLVYQSCVGHKVIPRIEDLEPELKTKLWELCKPYVTETTPMEDRRDIARCYRVLDNLAAMKVEGKFKY